MNQAGIIEFFARHPVAGNLLMIAMLLFGVYGLAQLNRQVLPDFALDVITITAEWPGASTEDVEANVLEAIEPEVRFLDRVDRVESVAFAGRAEVTIRFKEGADMSKALTDVQAALARITTFPADLEQPLISQLEQSDEVCRIEVSGPFPEQALKLFARRIRDDLLDRGLSSIRPAGFRNQEIWVEVDDSWLWELDTDLEQVAGHIAVTSLDLPAGSIESGGLQRQLRSEELARTGRELGHIEILSGRGGEKLRLNDIARISESFRDGAISHVLDGEPAVGLVVRRSRGVDSIEAQRMVTAYLEELRQELPPTLRVDMFDVFADQATQRVRMLVTNGAQGLVLVLVALYLFLNGRVAFWVAAAIPVSIMAALGGMALAGGSLNMISMFALIMGLGLVVDDSVVVGEHAEMLHRRGLSADDAAETAARRMRGPVIAAWLTTAAAFAPLLTIGSTVGLIIRELPITIILVLTASVVECLLILPMHLKGALRRFEQQPPKGPGRFRLAFNRFRDTHFSRAAEFAFARRYSTLLAAVCALAVSITLLASGRVGFDFFPSPESDMMFGNFALSPGTSRERTREMVQELQRAAEVVEDRLTGGRGGLINYAFGTIGATDGRQGELTLSGDHVGAYTIELVSGEVRDVRNSAFMRAWEAEIRPVPGLESLTIYDLSVGGPPGRDLDIRLHGASLDVLKAAALDLRARLRDVPGLSAVSDNLPYGKQEFLIELTPAGRAMGFTTQSVARQVRDAFEGAIARRFARDQEEVIVRVRRLPADAARDSIRDLYLRAPDGSRVPLTEVATLELKVGFAQVRREDGLRQVSVAADVDGSVTTPGAVVAALRESVVPEISRRYGVNIEFKGRAEEQQQAVGETRIALGLALAGIYLILAWVFASYTTPLVVMSVIPFGLVGAIIGHMIMGYNLTMLSLMSILGLAGVIVNDSIVLVSTVKQAQRDGAPLHEAAIEAARQRLRPVVLTVFTTVGGLTPLLFERSLQAQLIQPLAVTLIFGLMFAPFLILFLVPAMLGIGEDLRRWLRPAPAAAGQPA